MRSPSKAAFEFRVPILRFEGIFIEVCGTRGFFPALTPRAAFDRSPCFLMPVKKAEGSFITEPCGEVTLLLTPFSPVSPSASNWECSL